MNDMVDKNDTIDKGLSEDGSEETSEDKRFQLKWTKLDNGSKLNRITHFIKLEKIHKNLSDFYKSEI